MTKNGHNLKKCPSVNQPLKPYNKTGHTVRHLFTLRISCFLFTSLSAALENLGVVLDVLKLSPSRWMSLALCEWKDGREVIGGWTSLIIPFADEPVLNSTNAYNKNKKYAKFRVCIQCFCWELLKILISSTMNHWINLRRRQSPPMWHKQALTSQ